MLRANLEEKLSGYGGPVVMVAITPPGANEGLPWDEEWCAWTRHCAHRGDHVHAEAEGCRRRSPHVHSGPRGCQVERRRGREWNETAVDRLNALRRAACVHVRRQLGVAPALLERVWEPQKRGVAHCHWVFGAASFLELRAVQLFVEYLREEVELDEGHFVTRAQFAGFGFVDGHLKPISGREAARYLASYLTGRNRHKPTMRDALISPAMIALTGDAVRARSWPIFWVSPTLSRRTFVTMRHLRRARHAWAWLKAGIEPPAWTSAAEAVKVAVVFRRCYRRRAGPDDDDSIDSDEALRLAAAIDAAGERTKTIRLPGMEAWECPIRATTGWREQLHELVRAIAAPAAPAPLSLPVAA